MSDSRRSRNVHHARRLGESIDPDDDSDRTRSPSPEHEPPPPNQVSDDTGCPTANQTLCPGTEIWFETRSVVKIVGKSIRSFYMAPHMNWGGTPLNVKETWWRHFRDHYKCDVSHKKAVRTGFDETGARRLRDIAYKVAKKYKPENTHWVSTQTRRNLLVRREDPKFKKRSEQASLNKLTGPKAGTLHTQGSISTVEVARKLAKQKGKIPTASEVFLHTHQRKKDSTFVDDRSKKTYEGYQTRKQTNPSLPDDQIWLEASGGWSKNGTMYGLGSGAAIFYERPTSSSYRPTCQTNGTVYQPSLVVQLQGEVESLRQRDEQTRKAMQDQHRLILQMQSQFNSMSQHLRGLNSSEMPETPDFEELCANAANQLLHQGGPRPDPGNGGGPGFAVCS